MGICNQKVQGNDNRRQNTNKSPLSTQQKPQTTYNREQRIKTSKFKHRLYQFCERFGNITSQQAKQWVAQTYSQSYHSTSINLDGSRSERKNRQQLLALFDFGLKNKWKAQVFSITGVFDKKGSEEWIAWIYRLWIPNTNSPSGYTQYLYSSISIFNMFTGLWEKSDYTQMQR